MDARQSAGEMDKVKAEMDHLRGEGRKNIEEAASLVKELMQG